LPLREPHWWYADGTPAMARVLQPIAHVWGAAAIRRHQRGESFRAELPVVCVGNLTAGGTGKTPLALLLAEVLNGRGIRPAFLTRGYGGRLRGPHWVRAGIDAASDVGDEPLLLARAAATLVCSDRALGAKAVAAGPERYGAIIMDDGLQNGSLAKDLVIAVVDGRRGIGNGLVMPAGPLRAPLDYQLGLADAVVVNMVHGQRGSGASQGSFPAWLRDNFGGPVLDATTGPVGDVGWLTSGPLLAYSGIGAPERFFRLLEHEGGRIAGRRAFADHHVYTDAEARELLGKARELGAQLCTTEKDWVRLGVGGVQAELRAATRTLAVRLHFSEPDGLRLAGLIDGLLAVRSLAGR